MADADDPDSSSVFARRIDCFADARMSPVPFEVFGRPPMTSDNSDSILFSRFRAFRTFMSQLSDSIVPETVIRSKTSICKGEDGKNEDDQYFDLLPNI